MLCYEPNAGQTFFGDDPGSFEVVLVGDQQERLVDEWLAVSTDRAPVSAYVGHDVGGLLKRAPIGDGVDDDVAVHVAEFAPNVRLLRARASSKLTKLVRRRISPSPARTPVQSHMRRVFNAFGDVGRARCIANCW